ncbi:hypothetical protein [Ammoniphilus resinae]|uniref:Uncharacterized protein n=1 Tax=Ammoniphilus resinae TaxID=861532 RepID=A0ABS4GPP9_9BACL|nr:hypothetical protein [Ammoniphilus resinae]MBP1932226.1 hypothetical protein [Ammoniphilus resinae]
MSKDKNVPKTPDFDQLNDRIIAEAPKGPLIGMRTNLDPENPEAFDPYHRNEKKSEV